MSKVLFDSTGGSHPLKSFTVDKGDRRGTLTNYNLFMACCLILTKKIRGDVVVTAGENFSIETSTTGTVFNVEEPALQREPDEPLVTYMRRLLLNLLDSNDLWFIARDAPSSFEWSLKSVIPDWSDYCSQRLSAWRAEVETDKQVLRDSIEVSTLMRYLVKYVNMEEAPNRRRSERIAKRVKL